MRSSEAFSLPAYSLAGQEQSGVEASHAAFDGGAGRLDLPDRYERVGLLGEGGMGRVWLGYDRHLGRPVALKQPHGGPDGPYARLLQHEAAITARLTHPGIVTVYDILQTEDGPLFVMERAEGEPLRIALQALQVAPDDAQRAALLRRIADAAAAVGHAHHAGVVHRDLSPNNVLLGADGEVWVLDWGLAARVDEVGGIAGSSPSVSTSHASAPAPPSPSGMGTPGFVAPEQAAGAAPDPRADVWSLGAILHRVVFGVPVGAPLPASARISPDLAAVVLQAVAHDPAARYQDARALAQDLQRWLDGARVQAYRFPIWRLAWRVVVQWRWPLLVILLAMTVGAAALVQGARQSARAATVAQAAQQHALQQETIARTALGEQLTMRAREALQRGEVETATALAHEALAEVSSPAARGVLALAGAVPRAVATRVDPLPDCLQWWPLGEGVNGLCAQLEQIVRYVDGSPYWRVPPLIPEMRVGPWPASQPGAPLALIVRDAERRLLVYDLHTGALRHADPRPGRFLDAYATLQTDSGSQTVLGGPAPPEGCRGNIETALHTTHPRTGQVSWFVSCENRGAVQFLADGSTVPWPFFAGEAVRVLVADGDGRVWAGSRSGRVAPLDGHRPGYDLGEPVRALSAREGQPWLLVTGEAGRVQVLDLESMQPVVTLPGRHTFAMWVRTNREASASASDSDPSNGKPVAGYQIVAVNRREVTLFSLPPRVHRAAWTGDFGLSSVAWSRDGQTLWTADGNGGVQRIPLDRTQPVTRHEVLLAVVKAVDVDPQGGGAWASGIGADGLHRVVWRRGAMTSTHTRLDDHSVRRLVFLAGGQPLWLNYGDGISLADAPGGAVRRLQPDERFVDLGVSPSRQCWAAIGTAVAYGCLGADGVNLAGRRVALPPDSREQDRVAVAVRDDGTLLVAERTRAYVLPTAASRPVHEAPLVNWALPALPRDATWVSPTHVGIVDVDGVVTVYEVGAGAAIAQWQAHSSQGASIAVSPDGRWVATAGWDATARLAELAPVLAQ